MSLSVGMILAANPQGIIGQGGKIPWRKPADLKRFKQITLDSVIVMGRKTWDSIGHRQLPGRKTVVMSRTIQEGVPTVTSVRDALTQRYDGSTYPQDMPYLSKQVWFIGGSEIYEHALSIVDIIDMTVVLDYVGVPDEHTVYFKSFGFEYPGFRCIQRSLNPEDSTLLHCTFTRI
jgi:dihydrofolate reductase